MEPAGIALQARAWFSENRESQDYYLHAVIALIVMVTSLILSSMPVVAKRRLGL